MNLPPKLVFRCYADGAGLPGAFVLLTLPTRQKNPFTIIVGPADADGVLRVTREQLETSIRRQANLFVMDYTGLNDLTGQISFRPMNEAALDAALKAYALYQPYAAKRGLTLYADGYAEALMAAKRHIAQLRPQKISARAELSSARGTGSVPRVQITNGQNGRTYSAAMSQRWRKPDASRPRLTRAASAAG